LYRYTEAKSSKILALSLMMKGGGAVQVERC
jgi:hypothetical protein